MAVKKREETEEITVDTNVVEPQEVKEETKEAEEITLVNTEKTVVKEESVRVKPKVTYSTHIGGTNYYFEKGVCQNVPPNVKRIMQDGDMLLPL